MKKYNLSEIMKAAWKLVKEAGKSMSEALKAAWAEAKGVAIEAVKTLKEKLIERMELMCADGNEAGVFNFEAYVTDWAKGGHDRTYLKIVKTRNHSNMHQEFEYGYFDNNKNIYVPGRMAKLDLRKGYGFYGDSEYAEIV